MSVISQTIVGSDEKLQNFTASSDCVVSIRGYVGCDRSGVRGTLSICSVNVLSGKSDETIYFEYKGLVLKKNDKITVTHYASAHISGFTIEG